jgi:hypothetical protein
MHLPPAAISNTTTTSECLCLVRPALFDAASLETARPHVTAPLTIDQPAPRSGQRPSRSSTCLKHAPLPKAPSGPRRSSSQRSHPTSSIVDGSGNGGCASCVSEAHFFLSSSRKPSCPCLPAQQLLSAYNEEWPRGVVASTHAPVDGVMDCNITAAVAHTGGWAAE